MQAETIIVNKSATAVSPTTTLRDKGLFLSLWIIIFDADSPSAERESRRQFLLAARIFLYPRLFTGKYLRADMNCSHVSDRADILS